VSDKRRRLIANVAGLAAVGVIAVVIMSVAAPARPVASQPVVVVAPAPAVTPAHVAVIAPGKNLIGYGKPFDAIPPLEYDRPYTGTLVTTRVGSQAEVRELCPKTPFVALGCAFLWKGQNSCLIVLADDATIRAAGWDPAVVLRHETGHCAGWSPDHEGARPNNAPTLAEHQARMTGGR
jgi:hypothetical protein